MRRHANAIGPGRMLLSGLAAAALASPGLAANWQQPYTADSDTLDLYHFNQPTPLSDSGSQNADLSEIDDDGTEITFTSPGPKAAFGNSVTFDSNGGDRRLKGGKGLPAAEDLTLEGWFKLANEPHDGTNLFVIYDNVYSSAFTDGVRWQFEEQFDGQLNMDLFLKKNGSAENVESENFLNYGDPDDPSNLVSIGEWFHAAAVFDGQGDGSGAGTVRFSVNGQDVGGGSISIGSLSKSSLKTVLGNRYNSGFRPYEGRMDEFRISDAARSFPIPEPATAGLVLIGAAGGLMRRRRRVWS